MTVERLAADVLAMLDLQKTYFRTKQPDVLEECKRAEKKVRQECNDVLHPRQEQPALFDNPDPVRPAH